MDSEIEKRENIVIRFIKFPFRFFKKLCFYLGLITVIIVAMMLLMTYVYLASLPDIDSMKFKDIGKIASGRVYSKLENKNLFSSYRWVDIDEVNRELIYAIVTSEDATFFQHSGVNFNALLDSLAENISRMEYATGASTITQQVVKNLFFSSDKTIVRKISEIIVAKKLERKFKKNQILELYLNIAEFGPDIFGIFMAGERYFSKSPKNLTAGEGAFLALLLPSPRKYYFTIYKNKSVSKRRRKQMQRILNEMLQLEYISPEQHREYLGFGSLKRLGIKIQ